MTADAVQDWRASRIVAKVWALRPSSELDDGPEHLLGDRTVGHAARSSGQVAFQ